MRSDVILGFVPHAMLEGCLVGMSASAVRAAAA